MNTSKDEFFRQTPVKIINKAQLYSKTLDFFHELPKDMNKSLAVKNKADQQIQDIDFAVKISQYQQHLFRNKQSKDLETRQHFMQKINQKDVKVEENLIKKEKATNEKIDKYEKHVKEVFKKYEQQEHHKRVKQRQEAYKLRKELQDFYKKEEERKSQNQRLQVKVGTCYQDAVQRINNIHRKNQEYSHKAELSLQAELNRNNKYPQKLYRKKRIVSEMNSRKPEIYNHSLGILGQRQRHFIQTCGKNEDGFLNAWTKIDKSHAQMRKKKGEQTKKQIDKWRSNKRRVDEQKAEVPQKCLNILDKTSKASFRQTASSFRSTATKLNELVSDHKHSIYQSDVRKRDHIMDNHLDLTLKNCSTTKVTEKMHSMRQHARKIAYDFL